jgi:hypothetical protein
MPTTVLTTPSYIVSIRRYFRNAEGGTYDDEDPTPPIQPVITGHLLDSIGKQSSEAAGCIANNVKPGDPSLDLIACVPIVQKEHRCRNETAFKEAEQDTA